MRCDQKNPLWPLKQSAENAAICCVILLQKEGGEVWGQMQATGQARPGGREGQRGDGTAAPASHQEGCCGLEGRRSRRGDPHCGRCCCCCAQEQPKRAGWMEGAGTTETRFIPLHPSPLNMTAVCVCVDVSGGHGIPFPLSCVFYTHTPQHAVTFSNFPEFSEFPPRLREISDTTDNSVYLSGAEVPWGPLKVKGFYLPQPTTFLIRGHMSIFLVLKGYRKHYQSRFPFS